MKSTIISMLIVLVLLVIVPMYVFNDKELMNDLFGFGGGSGGKESIADLKAKAPRNISNVSVREEVKMYKWVDEHGVLQFSQTPPPDGGAAQEMSLKPQLNTMQAPWMPPKQEDEAKQEASNRNFEVGNPYSPKAMKQMMQQTKELTEQMNSQMAERQKAMEQMMGR